MRHSLIYDHTSVSNIAALLLVSLEPRSGVMLQLRPEILTSLLSLCEARASEVQEWSVPVCRAKH